MADTSDPEEYTVNWDRWAELLKYFDPRHTVWDDLRYKWQKTYEAQGNLRSVDKYAEVNQIIAENVRPK